MTLVNPDSLWGLSPSNSADGFMPHVCADLLDDFWLLSLEDSGARGIWKSISTNGFFALEDQPNGIASVKTRTSSAADNDGHIISSLAESWKFESKQLFLEVRVKTPPLATTAAIAGFSSVDTVGVIADGGAAPINNFTGAVWFRPKNGAGWNFVTSKTTTQVTTASYVDATADEWIRLGIRYQPISATRARLIGYINGRQGPIHEIDQSSAAAMHLIPCGIKTGAAAAARIDIDYVKAQKQR